MSTQSTKKRRRRKHVRYIPLVGIDMRYVRYVKPYLGLLSISVTLIFVVALLGILAPWPLKFIIDNVLRNKPLSGGAGDWVTAVLGTDQRRLTAVLGLALLFITVMQGLAGFAYEYINGLIQERATLNLRSDVFDHVQNLPLQFFDQSRLGDVLKRVNDDSGKIMVALVGSVREVKAFGREEYQLAAFEAHGRQRIRSALHSIRWEASFSPAVDFVQAASTAAVIWYGVSQVLAGNLSVGALLIFMSYLKDMYRPLRHFSKLSTLMQKAAVSGDRLGRVLDADMGIEDAPDARPLPRARGEIALQGVNFAYPGAPQRQILRGIDLQVGAGQAVTLVGGTGAGKSTITSLMMRFYDPTRGRIRLDGLDIRQICLADLRRQFAIVPQESVLFARSIRDNIAYGRPEATEAEIVAAARAANAHEFILNLPQGYNTVVGERGATLSGGQRQRIAIARAVLRDAPILILDEPTAALDAAAEALVMNALERLMQGRTTFIVAHRLSTIRQADLIVVLEDGRVVEQGSHEELLRCKGHYARLVRLQTGEAAADGEQRPSNSKRPAKEQWVGRPIPQLKESLGV